MGTIKVTVGALQGAVDRLRELSTTVSTARRVAAGAVPRGMSISTLTTTGQAGSFPEWADDQALSPLSVVLDIARLLETESGAAITITYPGEYSISALQERLADELTERLSAAESAEDIEKYLDMLGTYREVPGIQETVTEGLGADGTADLLTRAGDAGVGMEVVHAAFSDASQQTIAGWVGDDVQDPQNIDTTTTTLLAGFGRSEPFSTGLYDDVTPDQMTDAIQHLNHEAFEGADWNGPDETAAELYSQFINGAGTTFATYTTAVDDPEALADTWVDAITDDDKPGNASALTFLIRKGGENAEFDPDFLYQVTEDTYQWELDQDGKVWGPRDEGTRLYDPDLAGTVEGYVQWREGAVRSDGLANLLGSMQHTPEAAQRFFAHGYAGEGTEGDNSRIDYLMERSFVSEPDRGFHSDNGYGLGVALEAAASGNTTHEYVPELGVYSDDWSAGFATDLFEYVAHHENEETGDSWWPNVAGDNRYHGYPGTSVALGNIAAAYPDDVYELMRNTGEQYGEGQTLQIDKEQLELVLGQVGYHDDMSGLETLSTAMMAEGNERFREALEGRPPPRSLESLEGADLSGILDPNGEVMGNVLNAGLEGKYEGEELEKQRAAMAAKAFDVATNFVPGVGDIAAGLKDTLWETAIDTGKDEGLGALKQAIEGSPDYTADQYANQQDSQFQPLIRYNTYDQLLASGYLDEYDFPDEMIVGEGEHRRFRQDIRFEGVEGLPEDMPQRTKDEIDAAMKLLLTNDTTQGGPGAHLQGLISDALNGYDRVRPPR